MSKQSKEYRGPWVTALEAIEYGLLGDQEKCRAYAELLLQRLEQEGQPEYGIKYLRKMLAGETQTQTGKGNTLGFEPWFGKPDYFHEQHVQAGNCPAISIGKAWCCKPAGHAGLHGSPCVPTPNQPKDRLNPSYVEWRE